MALSAEDVEQLLVEGENERVEFKATVRTSRILAQNLAALANGQGGVLLLGVDDRLWAPADASAAVTGLDNIAEARQLIDRAVAGLPSLPSVEVSAPVVRGKQLLAVEVPSSHEVVVGPLGVQTRTADGAIRLMEPEALRRALSADPRSKNLDFIVERLTEMGRQQAAQAEQVDQQMTALQEQLRAADLRAERAGDELAAVRAMQQSSQRTATEHHHETLTAVEGTSALVRAAGQLRSQWKTLLVGAVLGAVAGVAATALVDLL